MATAWVTIAVGDLNHYLVAAQVNAINTAALGTGQSDRFTRVMTDVVHRIRLKIQSCSQYRVSATALTVPPSLRGAACLLIIQGLQASIPSLKLTEDQVAQITKYEKDLDAIAACELAVEEPTNPLEPSEAQSGAAVEIVSETDRAFTRTKMDGL